RPLYGPGQEPQTTPTSTVTSRPTMMSGAPPPAGPQPRDGLRRAKPSSASLELQILVRRQVRMSGDRRHLGQPGPDADQQRRLDDRREHRPLVHELLDLVQYRFAALLVRLRRLVAEQRVDLRIAAVRGDARGDHERLDPGCRVAGGRAADANEVLERLLLVGFVESRALHRLQAR